VTANDPHPSTGLDAVAVERARAAVLAMAPDADIVGVGDLGGHSGLTLGVDIGAGQAPARVVVKLAPAGRPATGRHDVVRQARLLRALASVDGVRVPEVLHVEDGDAPAVVTAWVEGECWEPILDSLHSTRPADLVRARALGLARMLAALHAVTAESLAVARDEQRFDGRADVERWSATMATVDPALSAGAPELRERLVAAVPAALPPVVVHGDLRLGNALCRGADVAAVIDWEIWAVADPRIDLGWFLCFSTPQDMPGSACAAPGMPSRDELLAAYEEALGERVPNQRWFDAAARYKMAAIMGNNLRRHRQGRRHDAYQETLVDTIPQLIRSGLALLDET
jgi:aminoglycoside phosphotransferase (APT) family kinase protein